MKLKKTKIEKEIYDYISKRKYLFCKKYDFMFDIIKDCLKDINKTDKKFKKD